MLKKCEWCGREFPLSLPLFQHRRVHSIYRPYICKHGSCCQAFTCSSDLQRHARTHSDKRIYMCTICKTRFLYRHHLKLHRCRIRNTKVYKCHLCSETFVQFLSLSYHIRKEHQHCVKTKMKALNRKKIRRNQQNTGELFNQDNNCDNIINAEDSGQKILLKIKSGTCTTLISPGKEKKSSHIKHKKKKTKRKLNILQPAVSVKNGLILKIRPVLPNLETKKTVKKHSKSRTKSKYKENENRIIQQSSGLKLKIRTDQGNSHIILNSEAEQKVPKLLVSKRNLENVQKSINKLSGSLLTSKSIVKKYKNKKTVSEKNVDDSNFDHKVDKGNEKLVSEPRIKNGIIIHKDRLGNYTSAEQIGTAEPKTIGIPKCTGGVWEVSRTEKTKSLKLKKNIVPKFAKGIWEVMPSPRPDGTQDFMKIRLSPQKPTPRLETNPDILYESSKVFNLDLKSKCDTPLSEDSDAFGASPATEKDLELGMSSVNDSGIEVLSSSSCNRSNGNSVRSVMLDENSPSYFHCEDSLMSFDSPVNDSSKYEHSICGKCGGIVMEPNNNTYSPTKCHCDSNSPSQDFHEKAGYIYISPLKDPSVSAGHNKTSHCKMDENTATFVNMASESHKNCPNAASLIDKVEHSVRKSPENSLDDSQKDEKSVFDFNEDDDFSEGKLVLDHVKNPLVLNKSENEKKQESAFLGDMQEQKQPETPRKRSKNNKLSRSPRRKSAKQSPEKYEKADTSPVHNVGLIPSKPIIIEDDNKCVQYDSVECSKITLRSVDLMTADESCPTAQAKNAIYNKEQDVFGLQLKNNIMGDTAEPIIVAIAKKEKIAKKDSEKESSGRTCGDVKDNENVFDNVNEETVTNLEVNESVEANNDSYIETSAIDSVTTAVKADCTGRELVSNEAEHDNNGTTADKSELLLTHTNHNRLGNNTSMEFTSNAITGKFVAAQDASASTNDDFDTETEHAFVDMNRSRQKESRLYEPNTDLYTKLDSVSDNKEKKIPACNENDHIPRQISSALNELIVAKDNVNVVSEISKEDDSITRLETEKQNVGTASILSINASINQSHHVIKEVVNEREQSGLKPDSLSEEPISELKMVSGQRNETTKTDKRNTNTPLIDMKDSEEDSLLQIPVPENEQDLNAALEQAGLGVRTAIVMNPDEDSLLNIPEVSNTEPVGTTTDKIKKSPLDLFQQQFLSFLSSKPVDSLESDKESNADLSIEYEKENKLKLEKRNKRKSSGNSLKSNTKDSLNTVDLITDGDSDSDFEMEGQKSRKRRKKSCLKENKEVNSKDEFSYKSHDVIGKKESTVRGISKPTDNSNKPIAKSHVIVVKSPNIEDDVETPMPDLSSDLEQHIVGKQKTKSVEKKIVKVAQKSSTYKQKHKIFDSDDSDFYISDSELERLSSGSSEFDTDPFEPKKTCKSHRQRIDSVKQTQFSVNDNENNKEHGLFENEKGKESQQESFDTQSVDSADNRSKRSKRGRKSICPCCIGSPGMHRKEIHRHRTPYKLPKNHKQFIKDTVKLLELKAKIHRLFLSLFPGCRELIRQSDINTIAFDDLIDDVLSTLKTDIQFEPGDIFTEPVTNSNHDSAVHKADGEALKNNTNIGELESEKSEALTCVREAKSSIVLVQGIHLMYSDDSVISTCQIPGTETLEGSEIAVTSAHLLPPLSNCDSDTINSEKLENENSENEAEQPNTSNVSDKHEMAETDLRIPDVDIGETDINRIEEGSKINYYQSHTCAQETPILNDSVVTNDLVHVRNDCLPIEVIASNDSLETGTMLTNSVETGCSEEHLPVHILSASELAANENEEIVITIDLGAAKVQLCKNPKSCLKQLHSKIVRLIWCLLPDLQVSPYVYESLENLEFFIDLIIMSNNTNNEAKVYEQAKSAIGENNSSSDKVKSEITELASGTRTCKKAVPGKKSENILRILRNKKEGIQALKRTRRTEKASLLKKLKTVESSYEESRALVIDQENPPIPSDESVKVFDKLKTAPKTLKSMPNETGIHKQHSKVILSDRTSIGTKKHPSKKLKQQATDIAENNVVGTLIYSETTKSSASLHLSENVKSSFIDCPTNITEKAQTSESTKRSDVQFEVEFEGNIFDKMDTVTNERLEEENIFDKMDIVKGDRSEGNIFEKMDPIKNGRIEGNIFDKLETETSNRGDDIISIVSINRNETSPSPVTLTLKNQVRNSSPEKTVGRFSPDTKRRSIDKNIFELMQPAQTENAL